jgi:hypothetical protein
VFWRSGTINYAKSDKKLYCIQTNVSPDRPFTGDIAGDLAITDNIIFTG